MSGGPKRLKLKKNKITKPGRSGHLPRGRSMSTIGWKMTMVNMSVPYSLAVKWKIYKYQIFYNSRYNKWDCSTDFEDFNNDDDDPNPNPDTFVPADFETSNAPMLSNQVEEAPSKTHTPLLDLLQYCFGFLPTFVQALYPAGVCRVMNMDWNTLLISLGYKKDSYDQPPFAGAMFNFFACDTH